MTTRPRRPRRTTTPDTTPAATVQPPAVEPPSAVEIPQPPARRVDTIQDRLDVLSAYAGPDGLIPVVVRVSHDGVYEGQRVRVPVSDRSAGLVEMGFLDIDRTESVEGIR